MKAKVLEYYGMPAGFDSWCIGFIYRNESIKAIILDSDGRLSDTNIDDIRIDIKGDF
jgi:hypothetical protein